MSDEGSGATPSDERERFEPDPERVHLLREVAADIRDGSSSPERDRIAASCYRLSDLYDPDEDTSPEEIYRNVRFILEVAERGGLDR